MSAYRCLIKKQKPVWVITLPSAAMGTWQSAHVKTSKFVTFTECKCKVLIQVLSLTGNRQFLILQIENQIGKIGIIGTCRVLDNCRLLGRF